MGSLECIHASGNAEQPESENLAHACRSKVVNECHQGAATSERLLTFRPPSLLLATLPQVVAIDATWSGAKNMVKRLPRHYRRVFIAADSVADDGTAAMPTQSLLRPVRKYRGADGRMCTLEAIVGLLRCVGESAHRCLQLSHLVQ